MQPDPLKRDAGAVLDILVACRKIESFMGGRNLESFRADDLIQSAVLFQLLVMGEAAKRVTPALSTRHREVPWSKMAGMRDRLIHGHDVVRLEVVWTVIALELPAVSERLRVIPRDLGFEPPA
jgi:uncharacterized protein with HEPN domain